MYPGSACSQHRVGHTGPGRAASSSGHRFRRAQNTARRPTDCILVYSASLTPLSLIHPHSSSRGVDMARRAPGPAQGLVFVFVGGLWGQVTAAQRWKG